MLEALVTRLSEVTSPAGRGILKSLPVVVKLPFSSIRLQPKATESKRGMVSASEKDEMA
ncbi:hypothetical protein D3C75_765390 [compost metagenome]